jgi:putative DNA primase/helicase
VKLLTPQRLRQEMAACASWYRITKGEAQPAKPPRDVIDNMLAQPNIDLPILERIVEAPVFGPGGSIETVPGYHSASRTYFANGELQLRPVSEDPTTSEVEQALHWIDELFYDFPFASEADELVAVAAMLGPFVRSLIDGSTPLHMFEAPTPGTGKGLLADVIAIPSTGRRAATITEARNEEEWRKQITAMLRNGRAITLIDNVAAPLASPALSAALTSRVD